MEKTVNPIKVKKMQFLNREKILMRNVTLVASINTTYLSAIPPNSFTRHYWGADGFYRTQREPCDRDLILRILGKQW